MTLMTTIGLFIFFLSATVAIFFSGYLMGKIKTMQQLGSVKAFKDLVEDMQIGKILKDQK